MKRFTTIMAITALLMVGNVFAQGDITFQVDMNVKMQELLFDPSNGSDIVVVRGNMNGWAGNTDVLANTSGGADSVWAGTLSLTDTAAVYKFVMIVTAGELWEDAIPNREADITGGTQTLPLVLFDDDNVVDPPAVDGTVFFQVDTNPFQTLGIFTPGSANDSLEVRGGFNGWGPTPDNSSMTPSAGQPGFFELNGNVFSTIGEIVNYKHYMIIDTVAHGNIDGWEEPPTQGGGNRQVTFEGTTNQQAAPQGYFMDIPPEGIVNSTVTLNFSVDMSPATTLADPFDPATDKVFFSGEDQFFGSTQGWDPQRGVQENLEYTDTNGDLIYELSFDIQAPTYYALVYRVAYGDSASATFAEGGGFDFGKSRARYIRPDGSGNYPATWTFDQDVFTASPPLVVETPPFVVGIGDEAEQFPAAFTLEQNYPNPFNPETTIDFSISRNAEASVTIYNMLGQKVRSLFSGKVAPGTHNVKWDATNDLGQAVTSGVYFYTLTVENQTQTRKMVLMR